MSEPFPPEIAERFGPVTLVGAGLAGSMMAAFLGQRGIETRVHDHRPDPRNAEFAGGRSINLALSTRGLRALDALGLKQQALGMALPMRGRMIHDVQGRTQLQPYGRQGQCIHSISRGGLTRMLVEAADTHPSVSFHFGMKCEDVDLDTATVTFKPTTGRRQKVSGRWIIGADGAFSAVRAQMQRTDRFNYDQTWIEHGYKELTMPPTAGGGFRMVPDALHIWPREDFMMIALPNPDGTFTCTLFLAFEGRHAFERLQTPADVRAFFQQHFPDAVAHLPHLEEEFFTNPTSSLVTIRCSPYHHQDRALLIGDAAHAVVPFYGQGMNAAFEDCVELDLLLHRLRSADLGTVLETFTRERKPNADAIRDLALYNFLEMRSHVNDPAYKARRTFDRWLHELAPDLWMPLYSMVTFSTIPYAEARERAERQDELLRKAGKAAASAAALAFARRRKS
ncbi:MAG: FAD-dependent monooxygenase [Deltaproteobacteria bacterium]|nr:MAG: FAD-dependent monooxygenase [Deltaproteobacteria bacterium]